MAEAGMVAPGSGQVLATGVDVPGAGWPDNPECNAPENTIALSRGTTYHRDMTTWQTPKRAGYMNPVSELAAALIGLAYGVVAG